MTDQIQISKATVMNGVSKHFATQLNTSMHRPPPPVMANYLMSIIGQSN